MKYCGDASYGCTCAAWSSSCKTRQKSLPGSFNLRRPRESNQPGGNHGDSPSKARLRSGTLYVRPTSLPSTANSIRSFRTLALRECAVRQDVGRAAESCQIVWTPQEENCQKNQTYNSLVLRTNAPHRAKLVELLKMSHERWDILVIRDWKVECVQQGRRLTVNSR